MRVTVWVDSWQFQCCGDDFGVGDTVIWRLKGSGEKARGDLAEHAAAPVGFLSVLDRRVGDGEGPAPVGDVLGIGGLRVFVTGDAESGGDGGTERWVGGLVEDRHIGIPEAVPATEAVVRRIRLFRLRYHADPADGSQLPTPGSGTAEDVEQAPRWPTDRLHGQRFVGFLVDLDVADA